MKKFLGIFFLVILIGAIAFPLFIKAQEDVEEEEEEEEEVTPVTPPGMIKKCKLRHDIKLGNVEKKAKQELDYEKYGMFCIMDAILTASDWIFFIVVTIAIIFVIWGGFTLITAGGSAEKAVKGRNYIVYAIVGFIVALMAKALPWIAAWFLTGGA